MEQNHRLYLFNGETFILVPESAWLDELKSSPTGITALKSADDPFIMKGWIKIRQANDPMTHAVETEWLFEETGIKIQTNVDAIGQLKVNGLAIGSTTSGETYKQLHKIAEEGKWVTAVQEVKGPDGQPIRTARKYFIPAEKARQPPGFEPGQGTKKPITITRIGEEKGGPHPVADILSTTQKQDAMSQVIGKYEPAIIKENPTHEEMIRRVNLLLGLAEKEENPIERQRLCEQADQDLRHLEAMAKMDLAPQIKDEVSGVKEYGRLAAETKDPKLKKVFSRIQGEEKDHLKTLKEINGKQD